MIEMNIFKICFKRIYYVGLSPLFLSILLNKGRINKVDDDTKKQPPRMCMIGTKLPP